MKNGIVVSFYNPIPDTVGLDEYEEGRPKFLLQKAFDFHINGVQYTIPAGFKFDYASVPRGLWNTFPPYDPKYAAASIVHDWAYAGELWPRKFNDDLFNSSMFARRVPAWKRSLMFAAVRIGGAFTYKRHTAKSIAEVRNPLGIFATKRPLWPDPRGE